MIEKGIKVWKDEAGQLHRVGGPAIEWAEGTKGWYIHGELHREDGPAIEWIDGSTEWYYKGKIHRVGGPASKFVGSSEQWWVHGNIHRTDGPAVINGHLSGTRWCLFGKYQTKKSVATIVSQTQLKIHLLRTILPRSSLNGLELPSGAENLVYQYSL